MMYRYDDTLKRLVPVAFTITKIIEINPFVFELPFKDTYTPMLVGLSSFTAEMQSMSDSVIDEIIITNHIEISDVYTPQMVDLSAFSVTSREIAEEMIIEK